MCYGIPAVQLMVTSRFSAVGRYSRAFVSARVRPSTNVCWNRHRVCKGGGVRVQPPSPTSALFWPCINRGLEVFLPSAGGIQANAVYQVLAKIRDNGAYASPHILAGIRTKLGALFRNATGRSHR